ncbi:hypothetical protein pEaSNUABM35_00311 [Erwinia phage pEa_SNUABM_35]|uniref:Uncharacterized protein n=1 Tax=Erwinia phage pEa_SNUABM_35 TaxID=2869557 RepID=A0AAE7XRC8_9CAUD|nr:hypothetical protein MPK65_gp311 [Erwinia phage pEa_SNUABM_35]QZE60228.1 hypothetical protein pEaSNUABM35_00311 [Erwinia phage pEa_SNUABM_35]QZE60564.1 hypothetical protein pEaSNUABM36_00311 [Erwinia phage pEa_SNUABM_36]
MSHKQILMNDVAIVLTMSERRAFLGPKADGFVYLPSKDALTKFEAHIKKYGNRDDYAFIDHRELHSISSAGIVAIAHAVESDSEQPWLWTKEDFRVKLW